MLEVDVLMGWWLASETAGAGVSWIGMWRRIHGVQFVPRWFLCARRRSGAECSIAPSSTPTPADGRTRSLDALFVLRPGTAPLEPNCTCMYHRRICAAAARTHSDFVLLYPEPLIWSNRVRPFGSRPPTYSIGLFAVDYLLLSVRLLFLYCICILLNFQVFASQTQRLQELESMFWTNLRCQSESPVALVSYDSEVGNWRSDGCGSIYQLQTVYDSINERPDELEAAESGLLLATLRRRFLENTYIGDQHLQYRIVSRQH
ncbi:hypothetical protein RB195_026191 [Necator americanus]|uniref:Uncharacterized protein n=1 Tax=Necator americanus TaxID=51031 RepID=A0ABR1EWB5_NECAM